MLERRRATAWDDVDRVARVRSLCAPKAARLLDRCTEVDLTLPMYILGADGRWVAQHTELRAQLNSVEIILLGHLKREREISTEFESEALEVLEKCCTVMRKAPEETHGK